LWTGFLEVLAKVLVKDNFGQGILDIFGQKRRCASKREGRSMLCCLFQIFRFSLKLKIIKIKKNKKIIIIITEIKIIIIKTVYK